MTENILERARHVMTMRPEEVWQGAVHEFALALLERDAEVQRLKALAGAWPDLAARQKTELVSASSNLRRACELLRNRAVEPPSSFLQVRLWNESVDAFLREVEGEA